MKANTTKNMKKSVSNIFLFGAAVALFALSACSNLVDVKIPERSKNTVSEAKLVELQVRYVEDSTAQTYPFNVNDTKKTYSFSFTDSDLLMAELYLKTDTSDLVEYQVNDVNAHVVSGRAKALRDDNGYQFIRIDLRYQFSASVYLHVGRLTYTINMEKPVPTDRYYVSAIGDGKLPLYDDTRGDFTRGRSVATAFFSLKHAIEVSKLTEVRDIVIIGRLDSDPEIKDGESQFVIDGTGGHFYRITGQADGQGVDPELKATMDATGTPRRVLDIRNSLVTISGLRISGGNARTEGGGVRITGDASGAAFAQSDVAFYNCNITGNSVIGGGKGGGIYVESSRLTLNNSNVYDNTCKGSGGGIYATTKEGSPSASNVEIIGGGVYNNKSGGNGGGVYVTGADPKLGSELTVRDAKIRNNETSGSDGGGIYVGGNGVTTSSKGYKLVFDGAKVWDNNVGMGRGSGVYFAGSTFEFNGDSQVGGDRELTLDDIDAGKYVNIIAMPADRQLTVGADVPVPPNAQIAAVVENGAPVGTSVLKGDGITPSNLNNKIFARFRPNRVDQGNYINTAYGYDKAGKVIAGKKIYVAAEGGSDYYDGLTPESPHKHFERSVKRAEDFTDPIVAVKGRLTSANNHLTAGTGTAGKVEPTGWNTYSGTSTFHLSFDSVAGKPVRRITLEGVDANSGLDGEAGKSVLIADGDLKLNFGTNLKLFPSSIGDQLRKGLYVAPVATLEQTTQGLVDIVGNDLCNIENEGTVIIGDGSGSVKFKAGNVYNKNTMTVNAKGDLQSFFSTYENGVTDVYGTVSGSGEVGKKEGNNGKFATLTFYGGSSIAESCIDALAGGQILSKGDFGASGVNYSGTSAGDKGKIVTNGGTFVLSHNYIGVVHVKQNGFTVDGSGRVGVRSANPLSRSAIWLDGDNVIKVKNARDGYYSGTGNRIYLEKVYDMYHKVLDLSEATGDKATLTKRFGMANERWSVGNYRTWKQDGVNATDLNGGYLQMSRVATSLDLNPDRDNGFWIGNSLYAYVQDPVLGTRDYSGNAWPLGGEPERFSAAHLFGWMYKVKDADGNLTGWVEVYELSAESFLDEFRTQDYFFHADKTVEVTAVVAGGGGGGGANSYTGGASSSNTTIGWRGGRTDITKFTLPQYTEYLARAGGGGYKGKYDITTEHENHGGGGAASWIKDGSASGNIISGLHAEGGAGGHTDENHTVWDCSLWYADSATSGGGGKEPKLRSNGYPDGGVLKDDVVFSPGLPRDKCPHNGGAMGIWYHNVNACKPGGGGVVYLRVDFPSGNTWW